MKFTCAESHQLDDGNRELLHSLFHVGNAHVVHLTLHSDVIDDRAVRVTQGGHEELVPKRSSVRFIVEKADRHVFALRHALTYEVNGSGISAWAL